MPDSDGIEAQSQVTECVGCDDEDCVECAASGTDQLYGAMMAAIGKIDTLTNRVKSLERVLGYQHDRLGKLEVHSGNESSDEPRNPKKYYSSEASKTKKKLNRVEFEKRYSKGEKESQSEEMSEVEFDLSALGKKSSGKHKGGKSRISSRRTKAVSLFSEEDNSSESSSSSGSNSSEVRNKHRSKRRIKSGAKVKKRPVLQTELWPHTIANEEDGGDVSSENISLAKFLVCFTHIMTRCNCDSQEASGRSELLHAVSCILECLPWADARSFHNLVMVKVEQRRITWKTKFTFMADQFIEKKVRQTLRSQVSSSGNSSSYKVNSFYSSYPSQSNKSNYLNSIICKQWNFASCSWGDRCNRRHVCWSCAEANKMNELHKATSHNSAGSRDRQCQGEQRF